MSSSRGLLRIEALKRRSENTETKKVPIMNMASKSPPICPNMSKIEYILGVQELSLLLAFKNVVVVVDAQEN